MLETTKEIIERFFSSKKRQELAKKGHALKDGSYPIENEEDLKNAWKLRKHGDSKGILAHIRRRANALGVSLDSLHEDDENKYRHPHRQLPKGVGPEELAGLSIEKDTGELSGKFSDKEIEQFKTGGEFEVQTATGPKKVKYPSWVDAIGLSRPSKPIVLPSSSPEAKASRLAAHKERIAKDKTEPTVHTPAFSSGGLTGSELEYSFKKETSRRADIAKGIAADLAKQRMSQAQSSLNQEFEKTSLSNPKEAETAIKLSKAADEAGKRASAFGKISTGLIGSAHPKFKAHYSKHGLGIPSGINAVVDLTKSQSKAEVSKSLEKVTPKPLEVSSKHELPEPKDYEAATGLKNILKQKSSVKKAKTVVDPSLTSKKTAAIAEPTGKVKLAPEWKGLKHVGGLVSKTMSSWKGDISQEKVAPETSFDPDSVLRRRNIPQVSSKEERKKEPGLGKLGKTLKKFGL